MSKKRTHRRAVMAAAAAMVPGAGWALPAPTVGASEAGPMAGDRAMPPTAPDPGYASEAEAYADQYDVSEAEAGERLAQEGQLSNSLRLLRDLAGDRLAGSWVEHQPELRGVIRLTGPVADQETFDAVVAGAPVAVEVRTDAALSLAELEAERARVQEQLLEVLPGAATGIHEQSGSVLVYAPGGNARQRQAADAALPEVRAATDAPVRVKRQRGQSGPTDDFGGDRLAGCTSGFSVSHAHSGVQGIITAAHCGPPQAYQGYNGENYALTFESEEESAATDIAFYTSAEPTFPEFYASSRTTRRTATMWREWAVQSVGNFVCHQGATTGYSCGNITDRASTSCWAAGLTPGQCNPNWVVVEGSSLACFPGDSGGPWFNGSIAWGIMHGGWWTGSGVGQCVAAVYTPIDFKVNATLTTLMVG